MKSSPMAGWVLNNQKLNSKAFDGNEMMMMVGLEQSQKPGIDLMQNCDLPPPMKVFTGSDKTVMSSMNKVFGGMMAKEDENEEFNVYRGGGENEKLELLKALRSSQTRAREAEMKAASLVNERNCLSDALLEEAMRLFAYRQWVRLLELQISKLQSEWLQQQNQNTGCGCGGSKGAEELLKEGDGDEPGGGVTWFLALAFCLGFVGVGFAFGYTYLF
ncbi:hypothetical protein RGQ29_022033 [Quercus rubra]|uniref:Uncharacterized protein n=1 Tax=Quercus rubra TaxID=3512 RepID=A0AAN7F2M9_QUERU|nr:hypothetical protein RGQ29_022033 [Quercus rubra]